MHRVSDYLISIATIHDAVYKAIEISLSYSSPVERFQKFIFFIERFETIRNNQSILIPISFFILPIVTDGTIFPLIPIQSRNTFCSPRFLPATLNINPSNQKNFSLFLFFSLWKNHSIFHRSNLSRSALSKSHLPR